MSFRESVETWTRLGEVDPLWAILSDPEKENGKWDEAEFFESGRREIDDALRMVKELGFELRFGVALDFGCGVGRLTQPLANRFGEVHGVDAAATMIERARTYDRSGGVCRYHVNMRPDLAIFPSNRFDFIYSRIVLQHIPPEDTKRYIAEFVRVLKPGGLLAFQLPSEPARPETYVHPFHAALSVSVPALDMAANEQITLRVTVTNTSPVTWATLGGTGEAGSFRLGNHWLTREGAVLVRDDGRAALPEDLRAGESRELLLVVKAPPYGGDYRLELDMVQEGQCWFKDYGVPTPRVNVRVRGPRRWNVDGLKRVAARARRMVARLPLRRGGAAVKPAFSMNAVPRDEVARIVRESGGALAAERDDFSAGAAWVSYFYYVTKATPSPPAQP